MQVKTSRKLMTKHDINLRFLLFSFNIVGINSTVWYLIHGVVRNIPFGGMFVYKSNKWPDYGSRYNLLIR